MRDAKRLKRIVKACCFVVGDFFRAPLVVVLGKNLHAITPRLLRGFDGFVIAAGNRHVGTENGHEQPIHFQVFRIAGNVVYLELVCSSLVTQTVRLPQLTQAQMQWRRKALVHSFDEGVRE